MILRSCWATNSHADTEVIRATEMFSDVFKAIVTIVPATFLDANGVKGNVEFVMNHNEIGR